MGNVFFCEICGEYLCASCDFDEITFKINQEVCSVCESCYENIGDELHEEISLDFEVEQRIIKAKNGRNKVVT